MEPEIKDLEKVEEVEESSLLFKISKVVLALILVAGMVYFSGLREYFFFRETPTAATISEMDQIIEAEEATFSINTFVIRETVLGSNRDEASILSMIENSSKILSQAGVNLEVGEIKEIELEREEVSELIEGNFTRLEKNNELINLILVKTLGELNGVAYPNKNLIIMPDYLAGRDYRTFAHEVGHVFGLGHKDDPRYVMSQGSSGLLFSEEEVKKIRKKIDEEF